MQHLLLLAPSLRSATLLTFQTRAKKDSTEPSKSRLFQPAQTKPRPPSLTLPMYRCVLRFYWLTRRKKRYPAAARGLTGYSYLHYSRFGRGPCALLFFFFFSPRQDWVVLKDFLFTHWLAPLRCRIVHKMMLARGRQKGHAFWLFRDVERGESSYARNGPATFCNAECEIAFCGIFVAIINFGFDQTYSLRLSP